jgi:ABC-type phosphate transport system auxiliary subunit
MEVAMNDSDEIQAILDKLPKADREMLEQRHEDLLQAARRAALAGIMARNFSHNLGAHASKVDLHKHLDCK